MTRLKHSRQGYLRYMQMSRHSVFAFVEGKSDPYFYGKICESVCKPLAISYEVCQAQELPGGAGGKMALLDYFAYLRRRSSLLNDFKGKTSGTVFFLDKDVDNYLRTLKRSPHVIYTWGYDTENHVFQSGNLIAAAAAAARLDKEWLEDRIVDPETWRRGLAQRWSDWVTLCLFSKLKRINGVTNYGNLSRINIPLNSNVSEPLLTQALAEIKRDSGLTDLQFRRSFNRLKRQVTESYATHQFDQIFKGKWFPPLFEAEIRSIAGAKPIKAAGIANRLVEILLVTLDFEQPWADHFKEPMRVIAAQVA